VIPGATVQSATFCGCYLLSEVGRADRPVGHEEDIVIRTFVYGRGVSPTDQRIVGPPCVILPMEDPIGGDKIDRGGVAPSVGAFAKEGGLVDTDAVPTVICGIGDGE
jgi:hypothetical protein